MSSDSSSSDEQTSQLKEAIDKSLLPDDLYKNGVAEKKYDSQRKPPKSLRDQNRQMFTTKSFSLNVTPEFQKYVARKLLKLLDKTIDDTNIFLKVKKRKRKPVEGGIKLFYKSKKYLDPVGSTEIHGKLKKCTRKSNGEEIDYEARAKEIAVSPEWVLSKEEVKLWASSWKNNVEIVKLDNCRS